MTKRTILHVRTRLSMDCEISIRSTTKQTNETFKEIEETKKILQAAAETRMANKLGRMNHR